MVARSPLVWTALLSLLLGCTNNSQAEVAGIWIPQATGIVSFPKGDSIPVIKGVAPELGTQENVRLAIARDVSWATVRDLRKQLIASGRKPYLMVADGRNVGAFILYEELKGEPINVYVSVGGKLCVAPPRSREAKCVQRPDKSHVDRAFTRELVREAVKAYGLHDVSVDLPVDLEWGDVVRAVDGARTCCFEDTVRVRLK